MEAYCRSLRGNPRAIVARPHAFAGPAARRAVPEIFTFLAHAQGVALTGLAADPWGTRPICYRTGPCSRRSNRAVYVTWPGAAGRRLSPIRRIAIQSMAPGVCAQVNLVAQVVVLHHVTEEPR